MDWKQPAGKCPHGLTVYKVDGTHVRNTKDSDFDQGGNGYRYPFIPKDEIWVDVHEPNVEVPLIVEHECMEAEKMKHGESYDDAHDAAKKVEDQHRAENPPGAGPEVVLVMAYNGEGKLLMGKRQDNERYTLPGGHMEPGEDPSEAAERELYEETGLRPKSLSFLKEFTGSNGVHLHCFSAFVTGKPHGLYDPDREVSEWEWIDVSEGMPPKVANHLHGPRGADNLVTQAFDMKKYEADAVGKVWHSKDGVLGRISIPAADHPDRAKYDADFRNACDTCYGAGLQPVQLGTEELEHTVPEVANQAKYELFREMLRGGDRLPPVVVRKKGDKFQVVDGNDKLHAARAEGGQRIDALVMPDQDLSKAEDEIARLLQHPDPNERTMALKLGANSDHLLTAALDDDLGVYRAAMNHPKFGSAEAIRLLESKADVAGNYPMAQQAEFLHQHSRVEPFHIISFLRTAGQHSPEMDERARRIASAHPKTPEEVLCDLYTSPMGTAEARTNVLQHPGAPNDVLDHAGSLVLLLPAAVTAEMAKLAVVHPKFSTEKLEKIVQIAADRGDPYVMAVATHALESGNIETPELAKIFKDLLPKAQLKPATTAPKLLASLLRNPNSSPELSQQAMPVLVAQAHAANDQPLLKSLVDHPAFAFEHLALLVKSMEVPEPEPLEKFDASMARHPVAIQQLGFDVGLHPAFRAARFLADEPARALVTPEVERAAMLQEEGDYERAALVAYGLDVNDANMKALHALLSIGDYAKAEFNEPRVVEAPRPEGEEVAEALKRAFADQMVFPIQLGGKHSAGSMIAWDPMSKTTWLLKSGSGGAGTAAGASQEQANPNSREAAFYHVAQDWGIDKAFPRAEAILVDGKLYAVLRFLGGSYQTLDKRDRDEPGTSRRVLHSYLHEGTLHKWAVIDYVCGQPDRHGQNVMVDKHGDVKLIDEGSAFAGPAFDPANDKNSFVPYYLRAWHLEGSFQKLSPEDKYRSLPRVSAPVSQDLKRWLTTIYPEKLRDLCTRYEIDPGPTLARLQRVQVMSAHEPVDVVVNKLWSTT